MNWKVAFSFLFLISFNTTAWADVKGITLDEAIDLSLKENLQIKTSERELEATEAKFNRTYSYFLPKVGVESRYEYFNSPYQLQRGGTANLYAEWNIYNGLRDWYDRKAKSFENEQARINRDKQIIFTKADVSAKFHKLLAVIESTKVFEEAIKRNDVQKVAAKRRQGAGLATDSDILEFDLYQSELQAELTKLQSELRQAQAEFRESLGKKDQDLQYLPQGKLIHFHIDDSLEDLKKRLPIENQVLIGARYGVEQAQANKKVASGAYLPQVDIKASYGSRGINDTPVTPETMFIGTAKWEFFSGFDTKNAQAESSANAAKSEAFLRQAELTTMTQLETAYAKLRGIQDRVDQEADNKVKAQKFFDFLAAEYKRGVKNSTDMRLASQVLLQVMLRDIQYRADFYDQKSLLEKAVGGEIHISKGSLSGHTD